MLFLHVSSLVVSHNKCNASCCLKFEHFGLLLRALKRVESTAVKYSGRRYIWRVSKLEAPNSLQVPENI